MIYQIVLIDFNIATMWTFIFFRHLFCNNYMFLDLDRDCSWNTAWHSWSLEDISRRKQLSMMAYNKLKFILDSKKTSIQIQIKIFNSFIASIFLYNSELWTLSKKLEHKIDVFHRSTLRRLLKIIWKNKVTNEELYEMTNHEKWSETIMKRRLH